MTAFVEGWGLYAESLGADLGIYRHPMTEFGRLNLEMWRAIRLVVDIGLHAFDWDRRRGEELFRKHTALPDDRIRIEVRLQSGRAEIPRASGSRREGAQSELRSCGIS